MVSNVEARDEPVVETTQRSMALLRALQMPSMANTKAFLGFSIDTAAEIGSVVTPLHNQNRI
ncbi:hypothetical protein BH11PAT3_BH11PAT3_1670 [soil metagenome]